MAGVLVMLAALLLSGSAMAQQNDKVVLQLSWEHEFQFAGYYAALWQGFYAQEGLDVELRSAVTPEGQFLLPAEQVLSGAADFGIGGIDAMVARGRGEDLVVLSTIFQRSPESVFSLESQPMDSLLELSQLRIASVSADFTRAQVTALFMEAGVDPNSIQFVDVPSSVDSLADGTVDAVVS
jgi:ABC-type nitrate/sulfonate/bicarbonate transport system substrate-binding protein